MSTPSSDTPAVGTETATPATGWGAAADTPSTGWSAVSGVSGSWRAQLPSRVRSRPRAYGTGRYGKDRYDSRDDTRYAWGRIAPAITLFLGILLGAAAPARAVNSYCETTDATTTLLSLCLPSVNVEGANPWGLKWNTNAQMIENEFLVFAASTGTLQALLSQLGVSTNTLNQVKASTGTNSSITQLTGLTTPLTVPQGGTGANSLTAHGLLIGEGASASTATRAMANGGLVIGAGVGVDPSTGTLTAGSAITVTNSAGAIAVGVDSSSAAVKSGGLILNSEIDGSSITKQGVGISSTGASTQFLQNMVIVGGLVKGGNFTSGGVGDAVLTATQAFSGSNTFGGPVSTTSVIGNLVLPVGSTVSTQGQLTDFASLFIMSMSSGTNTAWTGCTIANSTMSMHVRTSGSTVTITVDGAIIGTGAGNNHSVWVTLDNTFSVQASALIPNWFSTQPVASYQMHVYTAAKFVNIAAGDHTICLGASMSGGSTWRWNDSGNTSTSWMFGEVKR